MSDDPQSRFQKDQLLIDDLSQDESVRQSARLRQAFWQARFKKVKHSDSLADSFVGLWANLSILGNGSQTVFGKKQTVRDIEKFFKQPQLQEAIQSAGDDAKELLLAELSDSAEIYLQTCCSDSHYSSMLFGFVKLKDKDIAGKAARDVAYNIIGVLINIGRPAWSDQMIQAMWQKWPGVFPKYPDLLADQISGMDPEISRQILMIVGQS